jgi:transcriptional regulator with XRE-family HTH domain
MKQPSRRKRSAVLLDAVLKEAGSTTALAAELGMTEGAVRYWIRIGRVPSVAVARLIALNYEVSAEGLMGKPHER